MKGKSIVGFYLLIAIFALGAFLLAVPTAAMPPLAPAHVRLVSPSGSNSGDCTVSACLTIDYAIGQAIAGSPTVSDTIQLAAGTYNENVAVPSTKYLVITGPDGGTATTIINGNVVHSGPFGSLNNVTVQGNSANGSFEMNNSAMTQTIALRNVFAQNNGSGPAIYNHGGSLTVLRSGVYTNSLGIRTDTGASTVISQTAVVSNTNGVLNNGTFMAVNATIGGNSGAGISSSGSLSLNNVTVAGNGSGVVMSGGTNTVNNSIISNCSGLFDAAQSKYNILGSACGLTGTNGNQIGVDPQLGPATLGSPRDSFTWYYLPATGSPAVNAGNPAGCKDAGGNLLSVDQRDDSRPRGSACDLGSIELQIGSGGNALFLPLVIR